MSKVKLNLNRVYFTLILYALSYIQGRKVVKKAYPPKSRQGAP
jgi:hypothetical protein